MFGLRVIEGYGGRICEVLQIYIYIYAYIYNFRKNYKEIPISLPILQMSFLNFKTSN